MVRSSKIRQLVVASMFLGLFAATPSQAQVVVVAAPIAPYDVAYEAPLVTTYRPSLASGYAPLATAVPAPAIAVPVLARGVVVAAPSVAVTRYRIPIAPPIYRSSYGATYGAVYGPVVRPGYGAYRPVAYASPIVAPPSVVVRPKVYVRGQPVRNTLRAVTP
ncbi:MAG: hypothetical protein HKN47_28705 [Pirellulaceae bacterium]|nr:hypothetical protein [Pirellulaceae bacterium]